MAETKIPKEIADLNFEDALSQLEKIVRDLEAGQVKLDEAVKHYERGALLKRHCENKLSDARMKIEKITGLDDAIKLESMESE
ncbi:MAG: exodeoxyribonuclease VII small subunit [Rhodospirillaceae bacterium]